MQAFYPLPDEQQLRSDTPLPKFLRRIKQQLDLYELSEYAYLNQADYEMPYACMADLSKRRQASALIKQSITYEVLEQFPDEYTGREIIRALALEMHGRQNSAGNQFENCDSRVATRGKVGEQYSGYVVASYRLPKVYPSMDSQYRISPHPVAYVEASRDMQNSVVDSHEALIDKTPFTCDVCSKPYSGKRQLRRHLVKHSSPDKFKCTVEV
jgi:hypothetical protein